MNNPFDSRRAALGISIALGIAGCSAPGEEVDDVVVVDVATHDAASADVAAVDVPAADTVVVDATAPVDVTPGTDADTSDAPDPSMVTFRYHPQWSGVTAVTVIGGFGRADDWTSPFITLANDGSGSFVGSAMVAPGMHPYLFRVVGDSDGPTTPATSRYALDPSNAQYAACPMQSPTFSVNMNPCSIVTPAGIDAVTHRVRGTVQFDAHPIHGYLVECERLESDVHHFFVQRMDSAADGSFDFRLAPGHYRIQVLHPTWLTATDAMRDPIALQAARRVLSSGFDAAADVTLSPTEVAYHDYAMMNPRSGDTALPAVLTYTVIAGATNARAAVYGSGPRIGDPWWNGPVGTGTSATFDGHFNTAQATEMQATLGRAYWWGTSQVVPAAAGGVAWTRQGMVFPITFR